MRKYAEVHVEICARKRGVWPRSHGLIRPVYAHLRAYFVSMTQAFNYAFEILSSQIRARSPLFFAKFCAPVNMRACGNTGVRGNTRVIPERIFAIKVYGVFAT